MTIFFAFRHFFSFILHPAYATQAAGQAVGPGNLALRHYVPIGILPFPIFCRILEALRVKLWYSTSRFALLLERGNENIKYLISSSANYKYMHLLKISWGHRGAVVARRRRALSDCKCDSYRFDSHSEEWIICIFPLWLTREQQGFDFRYSTRCQKIKRCLENEVS